MLLRILGICLIIAGGVVGGCLFYWKKDDERWDIRKLIPSLILLLAGVALWLASSDNNESDEDTTSLTEDNVSENSGESLEKLTTVGIDIDGEGNTTYVIVETDSDGNEIYIPIEDYTTSADSEEDSSSAEESDETTTTTKGAEESSTEETTTTREESSREQSTTTKEPETTTKKKDEAETTTKKTYPSGEITELNEYLTDNFDNGNTNQVWESGNSRSIMHPDQLSYLQMMADRWYDGEFSCTELLEKIYECPTKDNVNDFYAIMGSYYWDREAYWGVSSADAYIFEYDGYRDNITDRTLFLDLIEKEDFNDALPHFLFLKAYYDSDKDKTFIYYCAAEIKIYHSTGF